MNEQENTKSRSDVINSNEVVTYVEPNWEYHFGEEISTDGKVHEMQMDLSDLNIAVELECEAVARTNGMTGSNGISGPGNKVFTITWNAAQDGGKKVSFMSGTKIYASAADRYAETENYSNFLTTSYADTYYYDKHDYGITEFFGIDNINIAYDSMMCPTIEISFTDIRGMALFAKSEQRSDAANAVSTTGDVSEQNDVQSFFQCFFSFPYPKFRILVKGFYGQSVNYELTCSDFKASFKPDSGDFEAKAKFVGYAYSFLNDISLLSIISAPYSDGLGAEYWKNNLQTRFVVKDKDGNTVPMKTFGELLEQFHNVHKEAIEQARQTNPAVDEVVRQEESNNAASVLQEEISKFYTKLEDTICKQKWNKTRFLDEEGKKNGRPYAFVSKGENGDTPVAIVITRANPLDKNQNDSSINAYRNTYDQVSKDLSAAIDAHNDAAGDDRIKINNPFSNSAKYGILIKKYTYKDDNTTDNIEYEKIKTESRSYTMYNSMNAGKDEPDWYKKYKNDPKYKTTVESSYKSIGGYPPINTTIYTYTAYKIKSYKTSHPVFYTTKDLTLTFQNGNKSYARKTINRFCSEQQIADLRNQLIEAGWVYTDKPVCQVNKQDVYVWLICVGKSFDETTINIINDGVDEKTQEEATKAIDKAVADILGPFASLVNLTKLYMAHFETFLYMMYSIVEKIKSTPKQRTSEILGLTFENLNDVPQKFTNAIPPFPRLQKKETELDEEGNVVEKVVETWPGDKIFKDNGGHWYEEDFVNSLLKGAEGFSEIASRVTNPSGTTETQKRISVLSAPTCFGDLSYTSNPFIDPSKDVKIKLGSLAKQVITRAFALSLNAKEPDYATAGKCDGVNMYNAHNGMFSKDLQKCFTLDTGKVATTQLLLDIALNNASASGYTNDYGDKPLIEQRSDGYHWVPDYKGYNILSSYEENIFPFIQYPIATDDLDFDMTISKSSKKASENGFMHYYFRLIKDIAEVRNIDSQTNSGECKEYFSTLNFTEGNKTSYKNAAFGQRSNTTNLTSILDEDELDLVNRQITEEMSDCLSQTTTCWDDGCIYNHLTVNDKKVERDPFPVDSIISDEGLVNAEKLTIPEFYGFNNDGSINTNKTLFTQPNYYNISANDPSIAQMAIFILSLDFGDLSVINKPDALTLRYIPYFNVVQFGAYYWLLKNTPNNTWGSNICRKWRWSTEANKFKNTYIDAVEKKFIDEFTSFSSTHSMGLMAQYSFEKEQNELLALYEHLPQNLIGKNVEEALRPLWGRISSGYIAIGTEIDGQGFKLGVRHNNILTEMVGTLLVPTLFLPVTKYVARDYTITRSMSEGNLKSYINGFIEQFTQSCKEGTSGNNFQATGNIQLSTPDNDVTEEIKISLYNHLKLLYDKWIPANSFDEWKIENFFNSTHSPNSEGHNFYFIDSFYQEVGYKLYYNYEKFMNRLVATMETNNYTQSLLESLTAVYAENKCQFICLQNFQDISKRENMDLMFKPVPYSRMSKRRKHPDFLVLFPYQASTNLDVEGADYKDDSFNLAEGVKDPTKLPFALQQRSGDKGFNVPAFGVVYGKQYQHYFKSIDVEMNAPQINEVALKTKFSLASAARNGGENGESITFSGQDLFSIYSANSYDCTIKMMGCAWVQPLMYFVLTNVPMFRGSYLIKNVKHSISNGNMETTFTGTRMANVESTINKHPITSRRSLGVNDGLDAQRNAKADVTNNCPYKVYPLFDDPVNGPNGSDLSGFLNMTNLSTLGGGETNLVTMARILNRENGTQSTSYKLQATVMYNYIAYHGFNEGAKKIRKAFFEIPGHNEVTKSVNRWPSADQETQKQWITEIFTKSPSCLYGTNTEVTKTNLKYPVRNTNGILSGNTLRSVKLDGNILPYIIMTSSTTLWDYGTKKLPPEALNPKVTQNRCPLMCTQVSGQGGNDVMYFSDNNKNYWKNLKPKETPKTEDKGHSKKEIIAAFQSCLQQSMKSNTQLSCDLSFAMVSGTEDTIKVTQKDGKNDHLHQVFDVAVYGYPQHVKSAKWCTNDATAEKPTSVILQIVENIGDESPSYIVCDESVTPIKSQDGKGFSKYYYMTAIKKYGNSLPNDSFAKKDFTSLSGLTKSSFDEIIEENGISVEDCENLVSKKTADGNYRGNVIIDGPLGQWDVIKGALRTVQWMYNHEKLDRYKKKTSINSTGQCSSGVQIAQHAGGLYKSYPAWGVGYNAWKAWFNSQPGWKIIADDWDAGKGMSPGQDIDGLLHIGDIAIMTHGKSSQHTALYLGKGFATQEPFKTIIGDEGVSYGYDPAKCCWLSDFIQMSCGMSQTPSRNAGNIFSVFRYGNG